MIWGYELTVHVCQASLHKITFDTINEPPSLFSTMTIWFNMNVFIKWALNRTPHTSWDMAPSLFICLHDFFLSFFHSVYRRSCLGTCSFSSLLLTSRFTSCGCVLGRARFLLLILTPQFLLLRRHWM